MKKIFISAFALATMVACTNESQIEEISSADKVYMELSIQHLSSRSGTDEENGDTNSDANPDYEVGMDVENQITSLDVVLRNENSYVSASVTSPAEEEDASATSPKKWIATFTSSQLQTNTNYKVYIYANCTAKQNVDATSSIAIGEMTADDKFWMTNAYEAKTVNFTSYSTDKSKPTDLGEHFVERAMARFDYKPKGPYTLAEDNAETAEVNEKVTIALTEAALINQSKEFYLLRRVSADGTNANWTVGGVETLQNYVVDVDFAAKANGYTAEQSANFDAHMTTPNTWKWESITAEDLTQEDNWVGVDDGKTDYDGTHDLNEYYVWQYCKENTIPGVDIQENGISTGVVFKGEITGEVVTAAKGGTIYVFDNVLYGTWDKVVAAAAQTNASEALKFAVSICNDNGVAKEAKTLAAAGFTGYSADVNGKYYAYYYYWNRHNDNEDNTKMGIMEFAVVRNNVYKLCVDGINKFGHPTPGGNDPDPDPVDPEDPDEEGEYYFRVSVKVLPWVVRVNHIEF